MILSRLSKEKVNLIIRVIICAALLMVGLLGMYGLTKMKKPPAEIKYNERPLQVEAKRIELEDIQVFITGYGEVKALNVVSIAPEVSGKIVKIHKNLEAGEIIPNGEVLFKIDPRNYKAAYDQAEADVYRRKNLILQLKTEYAISKKRLKTLIRNRDLGKAEFDRVRRLFEKDNVGTRSRVDASEQAYNAAVDISDQADKAVKLFPIRIKEAQSNLAAALAAFTVAKTNLERCEVRSPFRGRIKKVSLEIGEYVKPGVNVITIADDSILEIQVPLDSMDVKSWLRFNDKKSCNNIAWFSKLVPADCKIYWAEEESGHFWKGRLHRIVKFDPKTRTITTAIRVKAKNALPNTPDELPLVEGLFCFVKIPGKILHNVFRLPRWSVSFENTVYISVNNRLKTVPVKIAYIEGDQAFVSAGLNSGDLVITTRLINPVENALLNVTKQPIKNEKQQNK